MDKLIWEALLNIIMPKNVALLLSLGMELKKVKNWQLNSSNDHASGRKHVLPCQISILNPHDSLQLPTKVMAIKI